MARSGATPRRSASLAAWMVVAAAVACVAGEAAIYAVIEDVSLLDGAYWALQSVSTVGLGDAVPRTAAGRYFAVVASVVGIVAVGAAGSVVAKAVSSLRVLVAAIVVIVGACAGVLVVFEEWSQGPALFFACIAALSVGYGDVAPATVPGKAAVMVLCVVAAVPVTAVIGAAQTFLADLATSPPAPPRAGARIADRGRETKGLRRQS